MRHNSGLKHSFLFMQLQFPSLNYSDPSKPLQCELKARLQSRLISNEIRFSTKFAQFYDSRGLQKPQIYCTRVRNMYANVRIMYANVHKCTQYLLKCTQFYPNVRNMSVRNCLASFLYEIKNELPISGELMMLQLFENALLILKDSKFQNS